MALGDLPSVKQQFPDEAHEALRRYVDDTTVSVSDVMMLTQGLVALTTTFFSALDNSLADRKQLNDRVAALEARTLVGTTGQLTKSLTVGIGGSTTTFGITYAKPMPSADHIVLVTLDNASASLLGSVAPVLPVTNKTQFGCTVTVRNSALLTVASSVTVYVAALQLA